MSGQRVLPGLGRGIDRRAFLKLLGIAGGIVGSVPMIPVSAAAANPSYAPGWQGTTLIDAESAANWSVEHDTGSTGDVTLVSGLTGQAIQLNWNIGTGDWVQGKYSFAAQADLSGADIFGVSLHGGGAQETANTVSIMFADVNDVFYGYNMGGDAANGHGINQIDRWLINLAFPKKSLSFFFNFGTATQIDWSKINRFFIVVKRPGAGIGGGTGQLRIDQVQYDTAASWSRQTQFEVVAADPTAASRAIAYILSQQKSTGLFVSWKEEEVESPPAKAWLYDQALVLIALTREGIWSDAQPQNTAAQAAAALAAFLTSRQKADGHWARGWNPNTGEELLDDGWQGDQSWAAMALSIHSGKSGDAASLSAAQRGAAWLASQIDSTGKVAAGTEGNVDVWWAMVASGRSADADRIKAYLLDDTTVWDKDLQYWWRGTGDAAIAMDAATWLSPFARHPLVNLPDRGKAALSIVRKSLATQSPDLNPTLGGLDGMGPVGIWNEGIGQYIAAGGQDAEALLDTLVSQQRSDGSMPGSPENRNTDSFGWLTTWSGLAPTGWLYFAIKGSPFEPALVLNLNMTSLRTGDTLALTPTITPGPSSRTVDVYIALQVPGDAALHFLREDGSFASEMQPLVRGWGVTPYSGELFSHVFGGTEPSGTYTWLAAFAEADSTNWIGSIGKLPFSFIP